MKVASRRLIVAGVERAATRWSSLLAFVLGLMVPLIMNWWVLVIAAPLSYLAILGLHLTRARFWAEVLAELRETPVTLPPELSLTDEKAQAFSARIAKARADRARALRAFPVGASDDQPPWLDGVAELESRAVSLIQLADRLGRYLNRENLGRLRLDVERLRNEPGEGAPGEAIAEVMWAAQMCEERIGTVTQLQTARELVEARLEATVQTLEAIPSRLVGTAVLGSCDLEVGHEEARRDLMATFRVLAGSPEP